MLSVPPAWMRMMVRSVCVPAASTHVSLLCGLVASAVTGLHSTPPTSTSAGGGPKSVPWMVMVDPPARGQSMVLLPKSVQPLTDVTTASAYDRYCTARECALTASLRCQKHGRG